MQHDESIYRLEFRDLWMRFTKALAFVLITLYDTMCKTCVCSMGVTPVPVVNTGRIKALLLRHKNDYCGACFGEASAAFSAGYCGGRNGKGRNRKRIKNIFLLRPATAAAAIVK